MEEFHDVDRKKNNLLSFPLNRPLNQEVKVDIDEEQKKSAEMEPETTPIKWNEWILDQGMEQALFSKPMLPLRFEPEFQFWEEQKLRVSKLLCQQSYFLRKMKHLEKRLGNSLVVN